MSNPELGKRDPVAVAFRALSTAIDCLEVAHAEGRALEERERLTLACYVRHVGLVGERLPVAPRDDPADG